MTDVLARISAEATPAGNTLHVEWEFDLRTFGVSPEPGSVEFLEMFDFWDSPFPPPASEDVIVLRLFRKLFEYTRSTVDPTATEILSKLYFRVPDVSALATLSPNVGDSAYVVDNGSGQEQAFDWDGLVWIPSDRNPLSDAIDDTGLTANVVHYYTAFIQRADGLFVYNYRNAAFGVPCGIWENDDYLYNALPAFYRRYDVELDLREFLSIFDPVFDCIRTEIEHILVNMSIGECRPDLIPLHDWDLAHETNFELPEIRQRRETQALVSMYRRRGTAPAIESAVRAITLRDVEVVPGHRFMFSLNDPNSTTVDYENPDVPRYYGTADDLLKYLVSNDSHVSPIGIAVFITPLPESPAFTQTMLNKIERILPENLPTFAQAFVIVVDRIAEEEVPYLFTAESGSEVFLNSIHSEMVDVIEDAPLAEMSGWSLFTTNAPMSTLNDITYRLSHSAAVYV